LKHVVLVSLLTALALLPACHRSAVSAQGDAGTEGDTDSYMDVDVDSDSDSDSDTDTCTGGVWEGGIADSWGHNAYPVNMEQLADLAGYTEIPGNVRIGLPSGGAEIDSVADLACLTAVGGYLELTTNIGLTSLHGLHNLESIGGGLVVVRNDELVHIDDLAGLHEIGSGEDGEGISIHDNDSLTSIDGLSSITAVDGPVYIGGNESLTDIDGLFSLHIVNGWLTIRFNDALTSLTGLEGLELVGGELKVNGNHALADISALLDSCVETTLLTIENNSSLPTCAAQDLLDHLVDTCGWSGPSAVCHNLVDECEPIAYPENECWW
jgi:hypothetical protein